MHEIVNDCDIFVLIEEVNLDLSFLVTFLLVRVVGFVWVRPQEAIA